MIYIYDLTMNKKHVEFVKRYGIKYKFEKRFLMGTREFYSFVAPGQEKLLVVPGFAEQYREAETLVAKYNGGTTYLDCKKWVIKTFGKSIIEEDFPTEESKSGILKQISVDYKDIRIAVEYINKKIRLNNEFEIRDNNIFGNGIIVLMNTDMED